MSFRFKKFKVYQDTQLLHLEIFKLTSVWPRSYYYLSDQLRRASLSIVLNIAEGSSKQSDKDFNRFLTISLGSIDEVVACLELAYKLDLITSKDYEELERKHESASMQLGGFSKSLKA